MTRHMAELLTALTLALFGVYLMIKSMELPIGWVEGSGPGGGMFSFIMAVGILIGSLATAFRTLRGWRRPDPEMHHTPSLDEAGIHRDHEGHAAPFIDPRARSTLLAVAALLLGAVALTQFLGMYVGVPAMMLIYLRFIGGHSWRLTAAITAATPVVMFGFFELALRIVLPKGITEVPFQWLYAVIS